MLEEFSYYKKNMSTQLSKEKIHDLCKMFDLYIQLDLRPDWLPTCTDSEQIFHIDVEAPSSEIAKKHREELKKEARNKKKKESGKS